MNWLAWRQHRKQFLIAGIFFLLFAAFMIPTGLTFWHTYQRALTTCSKTETCDQVGRGLFQSSIDGILVHLVPVAVMFVPLVLGLFWGVPFLAREYVEGTNKLVWSQSVSRKKWLSVKLAWVLVGAAVVTGAFSALDTWWSNTSNAVNLDRFSSGTAFASQGIAPIGFAVFVVALSIMLGAWFKRTMAALGATLFLVIVIMLAFPNFVRPHYMTPRTTTVWTNQLGPGGGSTGAPSGALVVSSKIVNKQGQTLSWSNPPKHCIVPENELPGVPSLPSGDHHSMVKTPGNGSGSILSINGGPAVSGSCLESVGYHYVVRYQPPSRYWDFQRIETALYLGLSIIPLGITYLFVTKRDA